MTNIWPLRFRPVGDALIFTDEAGGWFAADELFLERYARGQLSDMDHSMLARGGHAFVREGDLAHTAFLRRWADRHPVPKDEISYVILVPTLRCNLACDYCQVSRAAEGASGFDWTDGVLAQVIEFLDDLSTNEVRIEFQGGEPLLRLDLLKQVRTFCRGRFARSTFVVCSNFQRVDQEVWDFLASEDTFLSTSVDGDTAVQTRQRTHDAELTSTFEANVRGFVERFGNSRLSALPTVDLSRPVDPAVLIDRYAELGLRSIYLRPINRQGFARRTPLSGTASADWTDYHRRFVQALIDRNFAQRERFEEFYLTHALRRVLRSGADQHVDLRNPNMVGRGYLVVDYDGVLYPSDEARMMSRVGQIDLSIGSIEHGIDQDRARSINAWSFNDLDPDCMHCAYQPYCGTDVVDDVSRYHRIDVPKGETWFCQRHLSLFDLIFELLRSPDERVQYSLRQWTGVATWPHAFAETHR